MSSYQPSIPESLNNIWVPTSFRVTLWANWSGQNSSASKSGCCSASFWSRLLSVSGVKSWDISVGSPAILTTALKLFKQSLLVYQSICSHNVSSLSWKAKLRVVQWNTISSVNNIPIGLSVPLYFQHCVTYNYKLLLELKKLVSCSFESTKRGDHTSTAKYSLYCIEVAFIHQ